MGFLDKIKSKGVGVVSAAEPAEGVAPVAEEELRSRLLAISGKGVRAETDGDAIVVAWRAKVAVVGIGASYQYSYRAIRVEIDADDKTVKGSGMGHDTKAHAGLDGLLGASRQSQKGGQPVGSETLHVVAWLGPHKTEEAADEKGFKFSWAELRHSVIDVVTGAGWTYKPKLT